ncbi:MAG: SUMF1/EgtB/PvdO family nonheme iron enzyme [Spirochaetales bacterium]|nr:SUMF1/EgtB/PvdO family nonheme iron enzyme [Spirochaetales bacterium]
MKKLSFIFLLSILLAFFGCKKSYNVTFVLDGGTRTGGGETSQLVEAGSAALAPEVSREWYALVEWDQDFSVILAELTVTAVWAPAISMEDVPVPSSGITFPIGTGDSDTATLDYRYEIGQTPVTWFLWNTVYSWSTHVNRGENIYSFESAGRMGSHGGEFDVKASSMTLYHPVTMVSWRDVVVWCNAATEWYNDIYGTSYEPVYRVGGEILRNSTNANGSVCDSAEATANDGFRMPTAKEWELAARWRGSDVTNTVQSEISGYNFASPDSGIFFTKGNSLSGSTASYENDEASSIFGWYNPNSDGMSAEVKSKSSNALGLYDMSGNVLEWIFDSTGSNTWRLRGGSWLNGALYSQLGYLSSDSSNWASENYGFRLARTPK